MSSVQNKVGKVLNGWIQILIVCCYATVCSGLPLYPQSGDWTCSAGRVLHNQTLNAGIQAGEFKKVGVVKDITNCIQYCCNEEKCNVAFMAKENCYLVSCNNAFLCHPVPAKSLAYHPEISYVTHYPIRSPNAKLETLKTFLGRDETINKPYAENNFPLKSLDVNGAKRVNIEKLNPSVQRIITTYNNKRPVNSPVIVRTDICYPSRVHKSVSLKYGPDSGEFYDYGKIDDMRLCVQLCCKDKLCDVAFMVGETCYTVSCYTFEKCQMIPSSPQSSTTSQLAYVIKKKDLNRKKKLRISLKQENILQMQKDQEKYLTWKFSHHARKENTSVTHENLHRMQYKKNIKMIQDKPDKHRSRMIVKEIRKPDDSNEPNVPVILTKDCKHNMIMKNHALIGGQKAGIYTFRGFTPGFHSCLNLCCADLFCDAAFLLGKRCYSIQCYKNGQCASRKAKSKRLQSTLAFIERPNTLDLSEKRTSIPGLSPTDRQYTVYLNITNEDYKEEMIDNESLEFLNYAEKLRGMISGLYGNVGGFKYVEILKFKPKKLVAEFNITADKSTNPKVLLQKMVDVLRKGELLSHEDPLSGKLTVDVRGFKFLNSKGLNLVCGPEFNYEVHWPLGIYGTFVSIPCPRMASGLTTRQCSGAENRKAKWLIPDFSDCVTYKYEALLREVQLLGSEQVHSPELTSASIIDRLLQLTTSDTYGSKPPKEFQSINNLQDAEPESHAAPKPSEVEEQLPFVKPGFLKETLPPDQLKSYLRKMGLSALLGKTNQPDLMSLYKSLSSENLRDIESSRPKFMKGSSSIKYPTPGVEIDRLTLNPSYDNIPSNLHIMSQPLPKPITYQFDKITTNNDPAKLIKANTHVFWSSPKHIGDLGAESPPGSQHSVSSTLKEPSVKIKVNGVNVPTETEPIGSIRKKPQPANITSIIYEHDLGNNRGNIQVVNQTSAASRSLSDQRQEWKSQSYVVSEQQNNFPTEQRDSNIVYNQDKLEPNGLPIFESRRTWMAHPSQKEITNAKQQIKSIRRRKRSGDEMNDARFNHLTNDDDIRRERKLRSESNNVRQNAFVDTSDDSISALLKLESDTDTDGSYPDHVIRERRNIEPSIIDAFFSDNQHKHHLKRIHGQANIWEIPIGSRNKTVNAMSRSNTPTLSDFLTDETPFNPEFGKNSKHVEVTSKRPTAEPSAVLRSYRPPAYRKIISIPTIIDIPTGHIVQKGSLNVANITTENEPMSQKETELSTSVSEATGKTQVKVHAEVEVNCHKSNNNDCKPKSKTEVADTNTDSKPNSNVINEIQVSDPVDSDDSVTPAPTTPVPGTSTTSTTTATTTRKPATTKPMPIEESPTVDPYFQDPDDETEPEQPTSKPTSKQKDVFEKDEKPKPIIQITVVNKTNPLPPEIKPPKEEKVVAPPKTTEKPQEPKKPAEEVLTTTPKPPEQKPMEEKEPGQTLDKEAEKEKLTGEENDLFTYEEDGNGNRAPMFGGDILIIVDITEELLKYVQKKTSGVSLQEVEEFLQAASALLDEANEMEWKHSVRHLEQLKNENEAPNESKDNDPNDWRIIHKQKSMEKADLLMGFVSVIETYATTVASLFTRYNSKFQQPIITKNIIMQVRILAVESLSTKKNAELSFPQYEKDERLSSWKCGIESISLPTEVITKKFEPTKTLHVTFLRFRTIALIQKVRNESEEGVDVDIVDNSPVVVGSQILTMNVEPSLGDELKSPVSMTFANDDLTQSDLPHQCSFWNATENSWQDNGCKKVFSNESITTCECNHFSLFGVLVDTSGKVDAKPKPSPIPTPSESTKEEETSKPDKEKEEVQNVKGGGGSVKIDKSEPKKENEHQSKEEGTKDEAPATTATTTTKEATTTTATTTTMTTTTTTEEPPTTTTSKPNKPDQDKQKASKKDRKWLWILLLLFLLLLLLLLLLICCCCCCGCCKCCRKRKTEEDERTDTDVESINSIEGSDTSLIDKSKIKEDPRKGIVTPGSTSSTSSPEPGESPGWRKLISRARRPEQMLLREKALLFKDYVQPYHFLSSDNERPDTSSESLYGGSSVTSYPNTSQPSTKNSPKRKRSYQPRPKRERSPLPSGNSNDIPSNVERLKTDSESSPDINKRDPRKSRQRKSLSSDEDSPTTEKKRNDVMPSNLKEAHSMEWDPYLESKQNTRKGKPTTRRRRNISPISEEEEEMVEKPTISLEAQNGSDLLETASSEGSTYTESAPATARTETDSQTGETSSTLQGETGYTSATEQGDDTPKRTRLSTSYESSSDPRHTTNR